ncbi:docking protein 2-like isoform X1 [Polyodon spathula]|uniref:docking protein 2-like isoform X1 n=1 Tax=Polyodon spathula TaxID=7913 RepID=UPI001B7F4074|nr:docking protein 2-like isoform X1 [Polyodon spathula]
MDEAIKKQGMLYLQQQRFGKKWKKMWSIVYGESTCSISRMEFFEFDKSLRKQENKKVIKLSDCIRVTDVKMDGCPKEATPFLVETTEKLFVFAAESSEVDEWTQTLCEAAFPMNWTEQSLACKRGSLQGSLKRQPAVAMEENSLYNTRGSAKEFVVSVRKTDATERCRLRGTYILKAEDDSLVLRDKKSGEATFMWPYRFLRRFGRDKVTFSFEAGRRCASGEGNFEFETKQGNSIFQAIESAINVHKTTITDPNWHCASSEGDLPPPPRPPPVGDSGFYSTVGQPMFESQICSRARAGEMSSETLPSGVKSLTLDPKPRKAPVKNIPSLPLSLDLAYSQFIRTVPDQPKDKAAEKKHTDLENPDCEYAVPFDTIAKNLMTSGFGAFSMPSLDQASFEKEEPSISTHIQAADPLYDSIDERAVQSRRKGSTYKVDHIYDEPEGCAMAASATSLYDDPEEVRGHAWKLQGTADPFGHEYPYNPHIDDYAVPKPPKKAFYEDEYCEDGNMREDESLDTTYDNVMVKLMAKKSTE